MLTVLVPAAVLALVVFGVIGLRGRGADMTPRGLLRFYLYLGSFAGVVLLMFGASGLLNSALSSAVGNELVYGRPPELVGGQPPCPPNTPACNAERARQAEPPGQQRFIEQRDRRRGDDLVRGITFTAFGTLFWLVHFVARRRIATVESASSLRRSYLMAGTVFFGLATMVLLPWGIYQTISYFVLPPAPNQYTPGVGDTLSGGIVALPVWLLYLGLTIKELRSGPTGELPPGQD